MRYIIYGAGAVGGTIGARLHAAGAETIFIARGAHLAAIQRDGLLVRTPDRDIRAKAVAVASPSEIAFRPDDVVLLVMKSHETMAALVDLERAAGDVPVISAQNGVANERMAARIFSRVYGMNILLPADNLEPGKIVAFNTPLSGALDAGCFPFGTDSLIREVTSTIAAAGFVSRAVDDVMALKYGKLVVNVTNGLGAIIGDGQSGGELGRRLRAEAAACFQAAGINWVEDREYRAPLQSLFHSGEVPGERRGGSSTWQSLTKGRDRLEVDYLNGEICLLGKLHGVPTPANALVRRVSQEMAAKGEPPGARTLADLERMLG